MLSSSVSPSNHRYPCPGGVAAGKEFCSRAIPGPGPSQNSALSGTPAPKVQGTYAVRGVPGFFPRFQPYSQCGHPAASRSSAAGSLRHQKPCVRQSQPHRFCCLRSSVSLRLEFMSGSLFVWCFSKLRSRLRVSGESSEPQGLRRLTASNPPPPAPLLKPQPAARLSRISVQTLYFYS